MELVRDPDFSIFLHGTNFYLLEGFHTRQEASRKYTFGGAAVYGVENAYIIRGAYIVRGQDYEPAFGVNDMMESFNYTKLDASKPEDRELVEQAWVQKEGTSIKVDGKDMPYSDGSYCL